MLGRITGMVWLFARSQWARVRQRAMRMSSSDVDHFLSILSLPGAAADPRMGILRDLREAQRVLVRLRIGGPAPSPFDPFWDAFTVEASDRLGYPEAEPFRWVLVYVGGRPNVALPWLVPSELIDACNAARDRIEIVGVDPSNLGSGVIEAEFEDDAPEGVTG